MLVNRAKEQIHIPLSFYKNAYCCGKENGKGLHAEFAIEGDCVRGVYRPESRLCGYPGIVHGGVLATLVDEAMFWAATRAYRKFCYAVEVNVRYKQPVPVGEEITITARESGKIKKIVVIEGAILNKNGQTLVKAEGKYFPFSDQQDQQARIDMQVYQDGYPF
ncbi:PaaI family thioesterase [bacterium]|nr:PaaI family thioesterase [bacterium]